MAAMANFPRYVFVGAIIGEGAAPDKGETARAGLDYLPGSFRSSGLRRSSSSSYDIEP
jgi:hypothetical protein